MYNDQLKRIRRQELRENQTKVEEILWQKIRNRQINSLKFYRQYSVGPYILDFFCPQIRFVIELDGGSHKDKKEYDKERELFLEDKNIVITRFQNEEILDNIEKVVSKIKQEIKNIPNSYNYSK